MYLNRDISHWLGALPPFLSKKKKKGFVPYEFPLSIDMTVAFILVYPYFKIEKIHTQLDFSCRLQYNDCVYAIA